MRGIHYLKGWIPQTTISRNLSPAPAFRCLVSQNPQNPPQSVGRDWAQTPVSNWPFGMQVSGTSGPRDPTDAELAGAPASPHLPDVEVIRWISKLSPFHRQAVLSTRIARRTWYEMSINLFSVQGLYRALVNHGGFPLGNHCRE
jgi:hypothetical protein